MILVSSGAGVGNLGSRYKVSGEKAAGLYMRSPMYTVHSNRRRALMKYMATHAETILDNAQQEGYDVTDERKLLLITGISRAQDYSMFAYSDNISREFDFSIGVEARW